MTAKVIGLAATTTMRPEQALLSALDMAKEGKLTEVLVVGYDDEGDLFVRSSRMDRKEALWLAEQLKRYALAQ